MPTLTATNQLANADFRFWRLENSGTDTSVTYQNVFGTSGTLYAAWIDNTTAGSTALCVKFYDTIAAPVNGTTHPDFAFGVPGTTKEVFLFPEGVTFNAGLGLALSDFATGNGTTRGNAALTQQVPNIVLIYK